MSLDADPLDRLGSLLDGRGCCARLAVAPESRSPSHPDRLLEEALVLQNAVYRLRDVQPAWTRYVILRFRYTVVSDDKHEGLLDFGYNTANGAVPDSMLPDLLDGVMEREQAHSPADAPSLPSMEPLSPAILERALAPRIRRRSDAFLAGMARRQERDLQRVFDYHHDLLREAATRLAVLAARGEQTDKVRAEETREHQRIEAIGREYEAKVGDVRRKFALKVDLTWLQTLELVMPVQRFEILIKRRKSERLITLDWNPIVRQLDQAPCEYSYTWERPREVCDGALHLVSRSANGPCPTCGKSYCRACSPAGCPKAVRGPGDPLGVKASVVFISFISTVPRG